MNFTDLLCADCGTEIGHDDGPKDGWQLEDGRTVCHSCCITDTKKQVNFILATGDKNAIPLDKQDRRYFVH